MFFETRKLTQWLAAGAMAVTAAGAAQAQSEVIIGSRESGSNFYVVAATTAALLGEHSDLTGKVLPAAGGSVWVPMMDYREVDMGVTSHYEAWLAWKGKGGFNAPHKMRTVVVGGGINVGLYVMDDSDITSRSEIKGLRMASEYSGSPAVDDFAAAELANAGLSFDDMQAQPRASLYAGQREDVSEGRLDVFYASVGSGITAELDSTLGIRFLPLDTSDEAIARMKEVYPAVVSEVKAGPPGIDEDMTLVYLPTYLVAHADVPEDMVYETTKTMFEHNDEFRAANKSLGNWLKENFATADSVLPYHDGAIKYFKEAGVWTDEMQAKQDALLAE
ncbi:TAXI family TRAP transporter solute-binding subunit [Aquicoccus sp. SCR17]|nr:TAXI family TRAP transporter solute-binding subunit [Carideicomes alvinocaridis]